MNDKTAQKIFETIDYLQARWQDEKEYEDWNDYVDAMKKAIEKHGFQFIKAKKRPFGAVCKDEDRQYNFEVKGQQIKLFTYLIN